MISLEKVKQWAKSDANSNGYSLHPDPAFLLDLLKGLKQNEDRFGYPSCPCRLASGNFEVDRDIICPCDYRDPDIIEFGTCYCGLFINTNLAENPSDIQPVPERRPTDKQNKAYINEKETTLVTHSKPVSSIHKPLYNGRQQLFYCKQCGYICFREEPPYICPICKAKQEMFTLLRLSQ